MRNIRKKAVCMGLMLAIMLAMFMPTIANANGVQQVTVLTQTKQNALTVKTLYVGNISVDGVSKVKYLYTDSPITSTTELDDIKSMLPSDYAALVPSSPSGQIKASNDSSVTVNDTFVDAGMVAANKYTGTIQNTSTTILYNQQKYNELVSNTTTNINNQKAAETQNRGEYDSRKTAWEAANPGQTFQESYIPKYLDDNDWTALSGKGFMSATGVKVVNPYIQNPSGAISQASSNLVMINGLLTQVNATEIDGSLIKVVNTSANVASAGGANSYKYIEGANMKYTIGQSSTATFRVDADFSLFQNGGKVLVDNREVSASNYAASSGSTKIVFTKDYMSSLAAGSHTLKVAFNDGGSATTTFNIATASTATTNTTTNTATRTNTNTKTNTTNTTNTATNTTNSTNTNNTNAAKTNATNTNSTSSSPKTGDNITTYMTWMVISFLGIIGTVKMIQYKIY